MCVHANQYLYIVFFQVYFNCCGLGNDLSDVETCRSFRSVNVCCLNMVMFCRYTTCKLCYHNTKGYRMYRNCTNIYDNINSSPITQHANKTVTRQSNRSVITLQWNPIVASLINISQFYFAFRVRKRCNWRHSKTKLCRYKSMSS